MRRFYPAMWLGAVIVLGACGEHDGRQLRFLNWPIINGTPDTSTEHQAVVAIESTAGYLCSATMITRRVLLTAAHCAGDAVGTYTVIFGNTVNSSTRRSVSEKWVHPQYNSTYIRNDIALMRLSADAPTTVTPIPHLPYSLRITQTDITSRTLLDFVGFGMTDPYDAYSSGTKMKFTDYLNYICTNSTGCSWPNPATSKNICQDQTPSGLCQGDSGGPAIVNRSGQLYVAGIASFTGQNCDDFGCNTKVDEYEADINNFIGGELGTSCTGDAQCDSGICLDGVCCESTCPGACKACNVAGNLGRCVTVLDGTACEDGNLCNGSETCQGGVCTQGVALDCTSQDPCLWGHCDQAQGCLFDPVEDGTSCSDANACNGLETCQSGVCRPGAPPDCNDGNVCTADSCDPSSGCLHQPLADGISCGGDLCGPKACSGGECLTVLPPNCDDQNSCTEDWCQGQTGCRHDNLPDGYECGECRMCQAGQCVGVPDCESGGCGCSHGRERGGLLALAVVWAILQVRSGRRKKWYARARSMRKMTLLAIFLVCGCAEEGAHLLLGRGIPIVGGTADLDPAHLAVVAIMDDYGGLCTATLISPEVLLTAAHCAQSAARSYTVYFGNSLSGATRRAVDEVRPHPGYDGNELVNDIALMRLAAPAPANVTPIPFLPQFLAVSPLDIGTQLEFVGFGEDEYGRAGVKLTVKNGLSWICSGDSPCNVGPGYYAAPHNICQDQSPGGPCSGDSGGPAFILREGREFVAGVTSFGDENCEYYGCSTKVDEFESFILEWVGGGLGSPCYSDAQCDSGYCEQGFCCESRCPDICMGCNVGGQWGSCVVVPDNTPCPDADACNGTELCVAGICQAALPPDCDDASPCTQDYCDAEQGCLNVPVSDGASCADTNLCDGREYCLAGRCVDGQALDCDDHNPCTENGCHPETGCRYSAVANGTDCSGGSCPQASCLEGLCMPADPAACDDHNPCTRDGCNPELGCVWVREADGTSCGSCRECRGGQCLEAECQGCGCSYGPTGQRGPMGRAALFGAATLLALVALRRRKGRFI